MKSGMKNKRVIKYIVVLLTAVIIRILLAFVLPLEAQKYAGPSMIVTAIAVFFVWDYLDRKKDNPK